MIDPSSNSYKTKKSFQKNFPKGLGAVRKTALLFVVLFEELLNTPCSANV